MCHQCHKPICRSCVVVTPEGSFCSSECTVTFRLVKTKLGGGGKPKPSFGSQVVMLVMLSLVLGVMLLHFAARQVESLQKFDMIGKLLGTHEKQELRR